jgi:tRNA A37 threonylcarbamoyltransferase TsaD
MAEMAQREGWKLVLPDRAYCGDNGVMMAAAAAKRVQIGKWPAAGGVSAGLRWE